MAVVVILIPVAIIQQERRIRRATIGTRVTYLWGDKPIDDVFPLGVEAEPPILPAARSSAPEVPSGWGFDSDL